MDYMYVVNGSSIFEPLHLFGLQNLIFLGNESKNYFQSEQIKLDKKNTFFYESAAVPLTEYFSKENILVKYF